MSSISPSLDVLRIAASVAEHGSFAAAAHSLGLSASAVSKSVSRLERQLGLKLFQRTTRSVRLTPAGEQLLSKSKHLLAEFDALLAEVSEGAAQVRGPLRITAPVTFGRRVIAPLAGDFLEEFPEVDLELDFTDRYVDLAAEPIDLAIRSGQLGDSNSLVSRTVFRDPLVLVASRNHAIAKQGIDTIEALRGHKAVAFRNSRTGRNEPWRFAGNTRLRPEASISASDVESVLQLVVDGLGIGQVPLYLALPLLNRKRITEVLPGHRPEPIAYSAVYLNRRLLTRTIRAFVDFLSGQSGYRRGETSWPATNSSRQ